MVRTSRFWMTSKAFEAGYWTKLSLDLLHFVTYIRYKSYLLQCSLCFLVLFLLRATIFCPVPWRHLSWNFQTKVPEMENKTTFLSSKKKDSLSLSWRKLDGQFQNVYMHKISVYILSCDMCTVFYINSRVNGIKKNLGKISWRYIAWSLKYIEIITGALFVPFSGGHPNRLLT